MQSSSCPGHHQTSARLSTNHCISTDDDFGFVAKDFVNSTVEGSSSLMENHTSHMNNQARLS